MDILEEWNHKSIHSETSSESEILFDHNSSLQNPAIGTSYNITNSNHSAEDEIPPSTTDEIMAPGYPNNDNIYERHGYVLSFNNSRRVPNWVCECVTLKQILNKCLSRKNNRNFVKDKDIEFSPTIDDFNVVSTNPNKVPPKPIYDRGHMAVAGNHTYNCEAYDNTFLLSNIAAMYPNVNTFLGKIEQKARDLAKANKNEKIYFITGTIFDAKREPVFTKKGSKVRVPDYFFKVILFKEDIKVKRYKYSLQAYEIENLPSIVYKDIKKARSDLDGINRKTGLNILCNIDMADVRDDAFPNYGLNDHGRDRGRKTGP